jgi:hypothetical protein
VNIHKVNITTYGNLITTGGSFNKSNIVYRKASLNFFRALWGDKPEGLLPENCPNFSFFFVCTGTSPDFGPGQALTLGWGN